MNLKEKIVMIDGKIYRYSKIVMLPTNKAIIGNIYLKPKANIFNETAANNHNNKIYDCNPQHLYFLSTDKICEGDWIFNKHTNNIEISSKNMYSDDYHKKVISSTNESLNLPKPSDSFLQVYIDAYNKNEKIEECLVEYEEFIPNNGVNLNDGYHKGIKTTKGEITIRKVKESWSREEVLLLIKLAYDLGIDKVPLTDKWISENL